MTPWQKAEVYFDPNKAVDGNAPAANKPPAWFVFWQQGGVPELAGFKYDDTTANYGYYDPPTDELFIGPSAAGTHYAGGLLINGVEYGGARELILWRRLCTTNVNTEFTI